MSAKPKRSIPSIFRLLKNALSGPSKTALHSELEIAPPCESCRDLERRLAESEARLKQRTGLLYETQRHYASEHFGFQESLRNLNTERLRMAGLNADRDLMFMRYTQLQRRIATLKERLRLHEPCDDLWLDTAVLEPTK